MAVKRLWKSVLKLLDAYTKKEVDLTIDNIEAIEAIEIENIAEKLKSANTICTAVGDHVLPLVAPTITRGLERRFKENGEPIDIYLCENNLAAPSILKKEVLNNASLEMRDTIIDKVGFAGMVVSRMVPTASKRFGITEKLFAVADSYHKLPYDGTAIKAKPLPIDGMKSASNFTAVFDRKLYTLNLTHAALGYLGYLKGYNYVHEPFSDKELNPIIEGAMEEISEALLKKYDKDLDAGEQREILKDIKIRFGNPLLLDSILRVARDPLRKLGPEDRLVGSASLCTSQGIYPKNIAYVCGAAFNYSDKDDESSQKLKKMIEKEGIENILTDVTGLAPESRLGKDIIDSFYRFKKKRKKWKK